MSRHFFAASAFVSIVAFTPLAGAQDQSGYASENFEPSETGSDWFANESLDMRGTFRPSIGVLGDYSYRSIIGTYNRDGIVTASTLRNEMLFHLGANVVFLDRFRLGASLPIQAYALGHDAANPNGGTTLGPRSDQGIGDLRISGDVRVAGVHGEPITLAVGAAFFAPTGDRGQYTGDGKVRFAPRVLVAGDIGMFAYSARVGYEYRQLRVDYIDSRTGSEFQFGGAAGIRVLDEKLLIGPELFGETVVGNQHSWEERATPVEILLGAHLNIADQVHLNAGTGTFIVKGYGAPVSRTLVGLEWAPSIKASDHDRDHDGVLDDVDACPDTPGVHTDNPKTNGCPPADRDGDGVLDDEDACPDTKGVRTSDPKTNGCPPPLPDRDGDGVFDNEDACPDVKGVRTNDPKTNGCPIDGDRDGDGIKDSEDACPDVAGIRTTDPKTNGCPDLDRDKDGVLNDVDACPDEPGPRSSDPKTSGCPRVFIKNKQIQILEQPKFDFNKSAIKAESDSILTEVAKAMNDHPEIKQVRVEGHTDSVGTSAYNKKLSGERAQAVVTWLTSHGVASGRLKAVGMGKETPLVANDTEANRAINRRVEFHIEEQDTTTKELVKTPSGEAVTAPKKRP